MDTRLYILYYLFNEHANKIISNLNHLKEISGLENNFIFIVGVL